MTARWLQFKSASKSQSKWLMVPVPLPAQSLKLFSVKLESQATLRSSERVWTERVREKWAPIRKSGALLQEGRVMVDSRQLLSRNSMLLSLWNRQLNGVQVANGRKEITELGKWLQVRKVWKWKCWWLDVGYSTQQSMKTSPQEASCCQWDAVMVGARGKQVRLTLPKQLQLVAMSYQTVK